MHATRDRQITQACRPTVPHPTAVETLAMIDLSLPVLDEQASPADIVGIVEDNFGDEVAGEILEGDPIADDVSLALVLSCEHERARVVVDVPDQDETLPVVGESDQIGSPVAVDVFREGPDDRDAEVASKLVEGGVADSKRRALSGRGYRPSRWGAGWWGPWRPCGAKGSGCRNEAWRKGSFRGCLRGKR